MILGVDIGTSNIKFVWYDGENCVDEKSCSTLDTIVTGLPQSYKEQNPKKILEILDNALAIDESRRNLKVKNCCLRFGLLGLQFLCRQFV